MIYIYHQQVFTYYKLNKKKQIFNSIFQNILKIILDY